MSKPNRFYSTWRTLATLSLLAALVAGLAAAPSWESYMNYQGQLTDSAGVTVPDGTYSIVFTIYDAVSGGTQVWTETQSNVQVTKGLFNVVLGSAFAINLGAYYSSDLFLGVKVGADAEMTPRQQLLPAVYAYNAKRLDGNPIGTGAFNIPQLNGAGKIPASMLAAGTVSVPMDMSGPGGAYNLHVNNSTGLGIGVITESSTGVAVSASTAATGLPAVYADGARYGGIFKTYDSVLGVALQAQGPGAAYASLVDRVNNAQVYGQAAASGYVGVLGTNSNGSGIGVAGQGGFAGVSASGTTYGVYAQGGNGGSQAGVFGRGYYGVQGDSVGNYGLRGTSTFIGTWTSGNSYGLWSDSGLIGIHAIGSGSTGKGIEAFHTGAGAGEGVHGETSSSAANAKGTVGFATAGSGATYGVYGIVNSVTGIGVGGYYTAGAAGTARGVQGTSNSSTGIGVEGVGYNGVRGASTVVGGFGVVGTASDTAGFGAYFDNTAAGTNATGLAARSMTSTTGIAIQAQGSASSGIGVSATGGAYGMVANGTGTGLQANSVSGYAIDANGYSGIDVAATSGTGVNINATSGYGVNITANNSWGIQINSSNSYGIVSFSNYGIYSSTGNGRAFTGYGSSDGIYANTGSSSGGSGVWGDANCPTCYGVYGRNSNGTLGAVGVYGQGFSAIKAQSNSNASNSINFESDAVNNPQYGFYHFASSALTNSYGMLLQNSGAGAIGAQITNQVPTGVNTGSALVVKGRLRLTDCSGRVNIVSGIATTAWTINSGIIGTPGSNCIESTSVILITPITNTSGYPLYVPAVGTGSFTVACATTLTNPQFYYTILGK